MDKYIDKRFERVERALASLIDSITKYTPSTTQAQDLAAADKELSEGLNQLQTHQNNYIRIQELRKETADLDAQIKSTVSLLWSTRKEITATPTTSYPSSGPRYDFTYSDLLNYARRISSQTLPPPGVTNGVDLSAPPPDQQQAASAEQTPVTATSDAAHPLTNGGGGGPAAPPTTTTTTTDPSSSSQQPQQPDPNTTNTTALPPHILLGLNPYEGHLFFPWPTEDYIRAGALAQCQRLADRGINPKNHDPEEEERARQALAEEQKRREAIEEAERLRREEERMAHVMRERRAAAERERQVRESAATGAADGSPVSARPPAVKKQFQFMGGLDDDEDDD
jgi:hypothetical protein